MVMSLLLLLFCQTTSAPPAARAVFTMERQNLHLIPESQTIIIDPEGPDIVFRLNSDLAFPDNPRIQASLVGPSITSPILINVPFADGRIVLDRAIFSAEGIYELQNTRLTQGGSVVALAQPDKAEIQVAEKFIISDVQVRQLDSDELSALGYVINEDDYYSVNFQLSFKVQAQEQPVVINVPAVFPKTEGNTFQPKVIQDPFKPFVVAVPIINKGPKSIAKPSEPDFGTPPDPDPAGSNAPQIPGLILIPGNFKYLKSHFDVTVLALNAAPSGFHVEINNLKANLVLPGPLASGALPITIEEPLKKPMVNPGIDGQLGSADDRSLVLPGEKASASYLIRGNVPGIHEIEIFIDGEVDLPQGKEPVKSHVKSNVYVRSPEFAVAFEHPEAVAQDESYDLKVRITNKGEVDLDMFSMTLDPDTLVGVQLDGSHPVQTLNLIPKGGEGTLTYRLKSKVTGYVVAGFFKSGSSITNSIDLKVAVAATGEGLSPYVLSFPPAFRNNFPLGLVNQLERFAKKAMDVSLTQDSELPQGLLAISPAVIKEFSQTMALLGSSKNLNMPDAPGTLQLQSKRADGLDHHEALVNLQLYSMWANGLEGYEPLDRIRRKFLGDSSQNIESEFASMLATSFDGVEANNILTQLRQEDETVTGLFALIVDGSTQLQIKVFDEQERRTDSDGTRQIPFSSMLTLSPTRTLIWCSNQTATPRIKLSAMDGSSSFEASVSAIFPNASGREVLARAEDLAVQGELSLGFVPNSASLEVVSQGVAQSTIGTPVPLKSFELMAIQQIDSQSFPGQVADYLGRNHLLYFSKAVDLNSIIPVRDHLFINGEPIVDGVLQKDQRTLIVSSKMPLGPYRPISYEIRNMKARDGQEITFTSGIFEGNPALVGVTISGQVADRNGRDLSQAKVFLWIKKVPEIPKPGETPDKGGWLILNTQTLDTNHHYEFPYAPFVPFVKEDGASLESELFRTFRVGILMPDGLYEEREITPLGAGQEVVVDFSFLQQATVEGFVSDAAGLPITNADVVVLSQHNKQTGGITRTDATGYYKVSGVEVGQVLVKAMKDGIIGINAGYLSSPGPVRVDVDISILVGTITGTVSALSDGVTTPLADVWIGYAHQGSMPQVGIFGGLQHNYTVVGRSDELGHYRLNNVPSGSGQLWMFHPSFDLAERLVAVEPGETLVADHRFDALIEPIGTLVGRLLDEQGSPIARASISVHNNPSVVNTDATGRFTFPHVPVHQDILVSFHKAGYQRLDLNLFLEQPHRDLGDLRMYAAATITGTYLNANGDPIPYGQIWAPLKTLLGTAPYVVIAQANYAGEWQAQVDPGRVQITGYRPPAIAALETFVQAGDHVILQEKPTSRMRVRVLDSSGNPLVAKVFLRTWRPNSHSEALGMPNFEQLPFQFSDSEGYVSFDHLNIGDFKVFARTSDLGISPISEGSLNPIPPDGEPLNVVVSYPRPLEEANLFGTIFDADGNPAPEGTIVSVTVNGQKALRHVDAGGNYRFDELVPTVTPVRVGVVAYNPTTKHYDATYLDLRQDLNFRLDLTLKRTGTLRIHVEDGAGLPVDFTALRLEYEDVTYVPPIEGIEEEIANLGMVVKRFQTTPANPIIEVLDVPTGPFVIHASSGAGFAGMRAYGMPIEGGVLDVTVRMEASSNISGTFIDHQDQPILDAEIQLRGFGALLSQRLSSHEPGQEGTFLFPDLPMRTYQLHGTDPASYLQANLTVTTSPFLPEPQVSLKLDPVAALSGYVYSAGAPLANAVLKIQGKSETILTGTDIQGRYHFENLPLGDYKITASSPFVVGKISQLVRLDLPFATQIQDLHFAETLDLGFTLLEPSGQPIENALVEVFNTAYFNNPLEPQVGTSCYTDSNGNGLLSNLPAGTYRLNAQHPMFQEEYLEVFTLSPSEPQPIHRDFILPGRGFVQGFVTDKLGQPLPDPVDVLLNYKDGHVTISTDPTGFYRVGGVPIDQPVKAFAYNKITHELASGTTRLDQHGETAELNITFRSATTVSGKVTFADGRPVPYAWVSLADEFTIRVQADAYGNYLLSPVLEGTHTVSALDPISPRKAALGLTVAINNGELEPIEHHDLVLGGICELEGQVTYSDGQLVRFGSVTLTSSDKITRITTPIQGDGHYYFSRAPLGSWELTAFDDSYSNSSLTTNIVLDQDQSKVVSDITFPPSFSLAGTLYNTDRATPVFDGFVKLWRPRGNTFDLIHLGRTDSSGHYALGHIGPGIYLLEAQDSELLGNFKTTFTKTNEDQQQDLYLEGLTWIEGTLADANGLSFPHTSLSINQLGRSKLVQVASDGSFQISDLTTGPATLTWRLAGGWITGSTTTVLTPGLNRLPLRTEATVSLAGRAILAKLPPGQPQAELVVKGIARRAFLDPSGAWILDQVPVGQPVTLNLRYNHSLKSFDLGSFQNSANVGTFHIDGTAPTLSFADQGQTITQAPYRLAFQIEENDPDSEIDASLTRVLINGKDLTARFTTSATEVFADLSVFPLGFLLGNNTLEVEVGNTSRAMVKETFALNLQLSGATVTTSLRFNDAPVVGEVKLGNGAWTTTDVNGQVVFPNVPLGSYLIKARGNQIGLRQETTVSAELFQDKTLNLEFVGEYRGLVLDPAGEPAPGVVVSSGTASEVSDALGAYRLDLLPLGEHELEGKRGAEFAWRVAPVLLNPGQTIPAVNLQLEGSGVLAGRVLAYGGQTPVAGAQVSLSIAGLPVRFEQTTVSDPSGNYRFEQVPLRELSLSAVDVATQRAGLASGRIPASGSTLQLDVELAPSGDLSAIILNAQGNPMPGLRIVASAQGLQLETVSDSNGRFEFLHLPYRVYNLDAEDAASLSYLSLTHEVDQAQEDLGSLSMVTDLLPTIVSVTVPDPYNAITRPPINLEFSDDRDLDHYDIAFGGVAQGSFSSRLQTNPALATARPNTNYATPEGTATYTLTLYDHFGQSVVQTGSFQIVQDQTGPVITIRSPLIGHSVNEAAQFQIRADLNDPAAISSSQYYLDDVLIKDLPITGYVNFLATAPFVEEDREVTLRIDARDKLGNFTTASRQILVKAISTAGGPSLTLLSPVEGISLPFSNLQVQVGARVEDPDGLQVAVVRIEGLEMARTNLSGTSTIFHAAIPLTPEQQQLPSLFVELDVYDLGGNLSQTSAIIHALQGSYLTFDQTTPLNLPTFDLSKEDQTLVLRGGSHIIDGVHRFKALYLVNGAVLSQTATSSDQSYLASTNLSADRIVVDYASAMASEDKGYSLLPNSLGITSPRPSHGGLGYDTLNFDQLYGSPYQPTLPGSMRGGGAVKLSANEIWLAGSVRASAGGTGSGGSVWLISDHFEGLGEVQANGYPGTYQTSTVHGGGGGRVAIYGRFNGTVEAYGGKRAGTGSVYIRYPDPTQADGIADQLIFKAHPSATEVNDTALFELHDLKVGTDLIVSTLYRDNQQYQVLDFFAPPHFASYPGNKAYKEGAYETASRISKQDPTRFWSEGDQSFGTFVDGDLIQIAFSPDSLVIAQNTRFNCRGVRPIVPIKLDGATLVNQGTPLELNPIEMTGSVQLIGNYHIDTFVTQPSLALSLVGNFELEQLDLQAAAITLSGTLSAQTLIRVAPDASINTPNLPDARLTLIAPTMDIQGAISAQQGGSDKGVKYYSGHGGLGYTSSNVETYDSLYQPHVTGDPGGSSGVITLKFTDLNLQGQIDATKTGTGAGSGGSILLEGQELSGSGSLAANGNRGGGGGRIAIRVQDTSQFTGPASAYGAVFSASAGGGGAGTVYWQTNQWPNGKLVIDNNGLQSRTDSTPLPGIGQRTLTLPTTPSSLVGSAFPEYEGLIGMYVDFTGSPLVRIANHTTTQLTPETSFPILPTGTSYHGRHRLDVLEVRGGGHLKSIDPIDVLETVVIENGSVSIPDFRFPEGYVFRDGSLELTSDPGLANLTLDNFQLIARYPMNLNELHLSNGASLTYDEAIQVSGPVTIDQSSLICQVEGPGLGLQAASLSLTQSSSWIVADRKASGEAYPIRAEFTGDLLLDASSTLTTSGTTKVDTRVFPWTGTTYNRNSHGGYGLVSSQADFPLIGSFADPNYYGGDYGGGTIWLKAARLVLQGNLNANGVSGGGGGSIRLEAPEITGNGRVEARPTTNGNSASGRIAVYYGSDRSFVDSLTFDLQYSASAEASSTISGAGTLFLKGSGQTYGELIVNQEASTHTTPANFISRHRLTGVTGLANLNMNIDDGNPSPRAIRDTSWAPLPPGLAGLFIELTLNGSPYQAQIVANSAYEVTLDRDLPPVIPAGTAIDLVLKLDRLTLKDGAQFFFAGTLDASEIVRNSNLMTSLWVNQIRNLPNPYRIENRTERFILNNPNFQDQDMVLDHATLFLDKPLQIRDLSLLASTVTHSNFSTSASIFTSKIDLQARDVTSDASSKFDVMGRGYGVLPNNHGGIGSPTNGATYGSLFQPVTFGANGSAGGAIHLKAQSINNVAFLTNGDAASAGSIWLEADTLSGPISASARGLNSGGGRIAIYAEDQSNAQVTTDASGRISAGTVYLRRPSEAAGRLVIDNLGRTYTGTSALKNITPIPAFAQTTLASAAQALYSSATQTTTLTVPSLSLTMDFVGYHLVGRADPNLNWPILRSTTTSGTTTFTLQGDASTLRSGDLIQPGLSLSALQLCPACTIQPTDLLILDDGLPQIGDFQFTGLSEGLLQPGSPFSVSFQVSDGFPVASASIDFNGTSQAQTGPGPYSFNLIAPNDPGSYPLVASAIDSSGNTGTREHLLSSSTGETEPPTITLLSPERPISLAEGSDLQLSWSVADNAQVLRTGLLFPGQDWSTTLDASQQNQVFQHTIHLPNVELTSTVTVTLTALDTAGNPASLALEIQVLDDATPPVATLVEPLDGTILTSLTSFHFRMDVADNLALANLTASFNNQAQTVEFAGRSAGEASLFWVPPSVSGATQFPITYTLSDTAGNQQSGSITLTVAPPDGPLLPSPLAYWTLDERDRDSNTSRELFHHNDGENQNGLGVNQPGRLGQAYSFDGVSALIHAPTAPHATSATQLTLTAWVRNDEAWPQEASLLWSGNDPETTNYRLLLQEGRLGFMAPETDGTSHLLLSDPLPIGAWIFVAATFDQGLARVFVNGALAGEQTWPMTALRQSPVSIFAIGRDFDGLEDYFLGFLDEVLLFSSPLSPSELAYLYQAVVENHALDFRPPADITNFSASEQGANFLCHWTPALDPDVDLDHYQIYLDGAAVATLSPQTSSWTSPDLEPLASKSLRISSVDRRGNQSHGFETTLVSTQTKRNPQTKVEEKVFHEGALVLTDFQTKGDLTFKGTQVTLVGQLKARNLTLQRGASITLAPTDTPELARLQMFIEETLVVDPGSQINVDGRFKQALPEKVSASFGGLASQGKPSELYGSVILPDQPGRGLQAGAVIVIHAQSVQMDGSLSARGIGESSGGSILVQSPSFSGTGHLDVSGGSFDNQNAGGGRIALHGSAQTRFTGTVSTGAPGSMGTLVLADPRQPGLYLGHVWPDSDAAKNQGTVFLPFLPVFEASQLQKRLVNNQGSLLELEGFSGLEAGIGLWLQDEAGQSFRVISWLPMDKKRGFLQLEGQIAPQTQSLRWIIFHNQSEHPLIEPASFGSEVRQ